MYLSEGHKHKINELLCESPSHHCDNATKETYGEDGIYFGSWFLKFHSMASWLHCTQACGKREIAMAEGQSGSRENEGNRDKMR